MNVRDPFGLHRNPTIGILRATATQAAREFKHRALEAGTHALEKGKQAKQAVETAVETALESASATADDMAFSVPRNVPSFNNPQRIAEDQLWGAATGKTGGGAGSSRGGGGGGGNNILGTVGGLFDSSIPGRHSQTLPMYKDKPYAYLPSDRARPMYRRKRVLGLLLFAFFAASYYLGWFDAHKDRVSQVPLPSWDWLNGKDEKAHSRADWLSRRERVVEAFELSWDAYERYAWGMFQNVSRCAGAKQHACACTFSWVILDMLTSGMRAGYDEFHPETKLGKHMAPHGLGWIIIDSLDTLMLMNLTSRLAHAREWVSKSLTWDQDQDVNTFETTIRMMGGLLSAHYLSNEYPQLAKLDETQLADTGGEDLYLEKARDLADRLMSAFDSPTGVPWSSVNIGKSEAIPAHDNGGVASTAETTTLQLEFKYLAKLTGEKMFWDKVENVMAVVDKQSREYDSLVPIYIDPTTGAFKGKNIRLGSRGDSYYEYLIKQYLQTNMQETVYLDMWVDTLAAVRRHLVTYTETAHYTIIGERPDGLKEPLTAKMDHLVCFMPGTIALAATRGLSLREARKSSWWTKQHDKDMKLAHELTQTCWGMYKYMATGLAAEITHFQVAQPAPAESWPHPAPPADFSAEADAPWRKDFVVKSLDAHNLQRPETVESLFYMWRITGDVRYREWGWEMFKSFMAHTAVKDGGGFTSLSNANMVPPLSRDNMESFWLVSVVAKDGGLMGGLVLTRDIRRKR